MATEAVAALGRAPVSRSIHFLAWAVYGSALRAMTRLDEAHAALMWAARLASSDLEKIEVARRLAILRAVQGRAGEARALLPAFLDRARRIGGRVYGQALVNAGAILTEIRDYRQAVRLTEDALRHLPANGNADHVSAVAIVQLPAPARRGS